MKAFVFIILFAQSVLAQNRAWTQLKVPNAQCGDGQPYSIFVSQGTSNKVALTFQGGGACWNYETCYGFLKFTDLSAYNYVDESGGYFSQQPSQSPVSDATMFYFPYCTGDVHSGRHIANYAGKKVFHTGADNVEQALNLINMKYSKVFANATQLSVYGYSAGAIGALVHLKLIDQLFRSIEIKSALLDAPGLHWGDTFWYKFTALQIRDYSTAITSAGLPFDIDTGIVASVVPALCKDLPEWNIGVMQGTRDRVMSLLFGDISMSQHEINVLSAKGIFEITKHDNDNCSAWVPSSPMHTFLSGNKSGLPAAGGLSPHSYATMITKGNMVKSYK